ncbi:transcription-repair coupling factor [Actinobacillus equuli]|nr:transcription-repair coupling factor [Actinobacillus equuli]
MEQVLEYGEYAVRGALLDLYPMGAESPFRLDFLMMKLTQSAPLMWIANVR